MARTGRPKTDSPKNIRFSIRLDANTEQQLEVYCNKNSITKGEAVRRAIQLLLNSS